MRILILVLSYYQKPYDKLMQKSMETWDTVEVDDMETVYYCGSNKQGSIDIVGNVVYLPVDEGLFNIGRKTLAAFEYALAHKEFDLVARVHSSIYVNKIRLKEFCETLSKDGLFCCTEAMSQNGFKYGWGGLGYIISRDVVKYIVDKKEHWNHSFMEDESMSLIINDSYIPYYPNVACSIDKLSGRNWRMTGYNGPGNEFKKFDELKDSPHHFYRIKQDYDRSQDLYVMDQLFKVL